MVRFLFTTQGGWPFPSWRPAIRIVWQLESAPAQRHGHGTKITKVTKITKRLVVFVVLVAFVVAGGSFSRLPIQIYLKYLSRNVRNACQSAGVAVWPPVW
jgi:hypothetical protein